MPIRWLTFFSVIFLLAACAKPPHQELDATEYLVARAYGYQASTYATDEYQAAFAALEDGRRLFADRNYPAARAALAFSRQHALRAYSLTGMAKAREAAEEEIRRAAEEEARRRAEEEARHKAEEEARHKAEEEARKAEEEVRKTAEARMLTEYRVGSNDNLASVAALIGVYGDPLLWPLLYQANRDQIKDPQHIYVGQILKIPRGLLASDFESARQKAREAGLFGLPQNGTKPAPTR
ncbi:MAG: LysM peptidoglycan-binding domain-containing protein [Desulfuromonadales bacterium]|nr:LysM peptidoglycan-binding domain-containing protein [Desulfuromonadales bacterium]